jgi:hypothetical protein
MLQWSLQLCVLVGKQRNEKYILILMLEFVTVSGYDFPHHVTAPEQWPLF